MYEMGLPGIASPLAIGSLSCPLLSEEEYVCVRKDVKEEQKENI